jgi:PEP-CTERM motif-containing protein
VAAGTDTTSSGLFFFGFINALVTSSGTQTLNSAGTVNFNSTVDAGTGSDGVSSNDWVFTQSVAGVSVGLGTVFFTPGHDPGAGTRFALNNSSNGAFNTDRTYSANLTGIAAGVPEPGTLTLFTSGAGLLLAGLLRFRRKS